MNASAFLERPVRLLATMNATEWMEREYEYTVGPQSLEDYIDITLNAYWLAHRTRIEENQDVEISGPRGLFITEWHEYVCVDYISAAGERRWWLVTRDEAPYHIDLIGSTDLRIDNTGIFASVSPPHIIGMKHDAE